MTELILLNVPFEANYKDTVYFATPGEQLDYMYAHEVESVNKQITGFNYQRKDGVIRYPAHIDTLYECNYVTYKNEKGQRMFAFITDMTYVNDERTDISIETDVIQTWMFKYSVKSSFVEREHVTDDAIGLHTVPEQLETGEYICTNKIDKTALRSVGIVVGATIDIGLLEPLTDGIFGAGADKFPAVEGRKYNSIYSGIQYFYFSDVDKLNAKLKQVAECGQSDGIVCMFMCPNTIIKTTSRQGGVTDDTMFSLYDPTILVVDSVVGSTKIAWNNVDADVIPSKPTSIDGYTPKNKKLLTHPFCYLLASNNAGACNIYHYELFRDFQGNVTPVDFEIIGSVTPGMSIRLIPQNYKGVANNNNEGLNLGKFPICAWTSDVYTNWLTQNAVNIAVDVTRSVTDIVTGVAMVGTGIPMVAGVGGGTMIGGAMAIGSTIGQIYQHSLIPPAVNGNVNSGDVTFSSGMLTFSLYQMSIKKEYAQIIDNYFDMFGYKVNRVKVPNKAHRSRYWYTKTIDVNIDGAIPNKDLQKIKECYDRGITFWRANTTMGDYSGANNIL